MKVENFEAAVHFYGKAIELNPANAVYFCNRCNLEYGGGGSCCQGPGRAVGENGESGGTQGWGGDGSAAILNGTPGQVGSQASVSVSRYKHGHSAGPGLPLLATLPLPHQVARETGRGAVRRGCEEEPAPRPFCLSSPRAAAYSKLGNYAGAVQDCERAICIDPSYSKAYGRMG